MAKRKSKPTSPPERPPLKAKPHMSVYLDPKVSRVLKQIALDHYRNAHSVVLEGIDMVIAKYRPNLTMKKIIDG